MKKLLALLLALLLPIAAAAETLLTPGEADASATLADYVGTWDATVADIGGMQMTMAEVGLRMTVIVAGNGSASIQEGSEEMMALAAVENGVLVLSVDGAPAMHLTLHTGGVLSYAVGETETIYFEKTGG